MTKEEKSWILYDVANSAFTLIIVTAIMPIFFKSFACKGISGAESTALWGYGNSAASLIVAVLAPILGTFADYKNNKKRFFIFFATMGIVFTFMLSSATEGNWLYALLIYGLGVIGYSGSNVFYDSFLVDVTSHKKMNRLSASGYAWGYIGSTIPFIACIALIMLGKKTGNSVLMTRLAFIVTGIWWLAFTIPAIRNLKQKYCIPPSSRPVRDSFARLFETFRRVKKHRQAFLFMLAYFFYIDGVYTVIKMAVPYGEDIGLSPGQLMTIVLAIQFVAFPFALLYGKLAEKYSAKKMLFAGIGIYIIITIVGFIIPSLESKTLKLAFFWTMAMLVATSQGGIQSLSRSFFAQIIPKCKSAEFFGFYNIFGKFAAILGPLLMGFAIQLTGNSKYGILSLIMLFIAGAAILSRIKVEESK